MSYKFSRRDFLKYSALTAVAVAGAGMLSGCEIQDPSNPVYAVGTTISVGNTKAKLTLAETKKLDGNFKLEITNSSDAPLLVTADRFNVVVKATGADGKETVVYNSAFSGNGLTITNPTATADTYPNIPKKSSATLNITAVGFPTDLDTYASYTMVFQYIPVASQAEQSMRWKATGPSKA